MAKKAVSCLNVSKGIFHYFLGNLLGDMKYGPGNRPYWDMKEGRAQSRYPNLIRALSKEPDTSRQRQLFESHRLRIGSTSGVSRMWIEQGRAKAYSQ